MISVYLSMLESPEDKSRFEQLYCKYERLMLYVAYNYLKDFRQAEDAVNDAFIKIIEHFDKIDEIDCPQTKRYVVTVVKNVCVDIHRKNTRHREVAIESEDGINILDIVENEPSAQDAYFEKYEKEEIKEAFKKLSEDYQIALYYTAALKKSVKEIAEITNSNPETIKKRIYRARKELRGLLENNE